MLLGASWSNNSIRVLTLAEKAESFTVRHLLELATGTMTRVPLDSERPTDRCLRHARRRHPPSPDQVGMRPELLVWIVPR
jgi:hypothetical protein